MTLAPPLHRRCNDGAACDLFDTAAGTTLIDAGLPGRGRDLPRELRSLARSADDIRGLSSIRSDADHFGLAGRQRSDHGVPVFVCTAYAVHHRSGENSKIALGARRVVQTLAFLRNAPCKNDLYSRYAA